MRLRQPKVPKGTAIGVREAARKYGVDIAMISRWAAKDKGAVLRAPSAPGEKMLIDEAWLQGRLKDYEPHRDNTQRRRRFVEVVPVGPVGPAVANGHGAGLPFSNPQRVVLPRPNRGGAPLQKGYGQDAKLETPVLSTREYVEKFISAQGEHGKLRDETLESYRWTFYGTDRRDKNGQSLAPPERFVGRFPTIPLDVVSANGRKVDMIGREAVIKYLQGLRNLKAGKNYGKPLSPGAKGLAHRVLTTWYSWLAREEGLNLWVPDMTHISVGASERKRAITIYPDQTRALLQHIMSTTRDASERAIVIILAQTGARLGELCTIRKEALRDGWCYVWGKPTKSNPLGCRQLCLPDPAYELVRRETGIYGSLALKAYPLAGPLRPLDVRRPVDLRNLREAKETAIVEAVPKAEQHVEDFLRARLKKAEIWIEGMNAHSFRRAYQAEFVERGGSETFKRLLMGHFSKSDMDQLYSNASVAQMVSQARQFAPRLFLQEPAEQGVLALEAAVHERGMVAGDEEE